MTLTAITAPQASGEKPGRSDATKIDFEGRIAEVRYFIIATSPPPGKFCAILYQ